LPTLPARIYNPTAEGFAIALDLVESRGTILLKSTYNGLPQADLTQVAVREIHVVGSRCGPFPAALRLLQNGLVDVESLIDARYPFNNALDAFTHAAQPGMMKVLLEF
jgi:threonine dehydrogenase-like Zn-dependent dehydrogenase